MTTPTVFIKVEDGETTYETHGEVDIIFLNVDELNNSLGYETADEDVTNELQKLYDWADISDQSNYEDEAEALANKHEDLKNERN